MRVPFVLFALVGSISCAVVNEELGECSSQQDDSTIPAECLAPAESDAAEAARRMTEESANDNRYGYHYDENDYSNSDSNDGSEDSDDEDGEDEEEYNVHEEGFNTEDEEEEEEEFDENYYESEEGLQRLWKRGRVREIYNYALKCPLVKQDQSGLKSPVPAQEDWETYQATYREVLALDPHAKSSIPPTFSPSAIRVPFEVQYTPDAGRGIFATENIKKGTKIWDSTNTAAFQAHQYRKFLQDLPRTLACDVIDWAYTRTDGRNGYVCADLDHGSLINSHHKPNIGFLHALQIELETGCNLEFYALRDISAGEELRLSYDDFTEDVWEEMGL